MRGERDVRGGGSEKRAERGKDRSIDRRIRSTGGTHKISLTKKPTNPMTTNPRPVRRAILVNSLRSGFVHFLTRR